MYETATVAMPSGHTGYSMTRLALAQRSCMVVPVQYCTPGKDLRYCREMQRVYKVEVHCLEDNW